MSWLTSNLKNSIYGLLGASVQASDSVLLTGTEDVRESMLASLGEDGWRRFPQLTRRIRYASDIEGLWYLRGELMGTLANIDGELAARKKIASITAEFRGLLPRAMISRPSPLIG